MISDWRKFKGFETANDQAFWEPKLLWQEVLTHRRNKFPDLCLLTELVTFGIKLCSRKGFQYIELIVKLSPDIPSQNSIVLIFLGYKAMSSYLGQESFLFVTDKFISTHCSGFGHLDDVSRSKAHS